MSREKEALERAAVEQFIFLFSEENPDRTIELQSMRCPPEPDAKIILDGQELYVEVSHVYGTETDARVYLGRTGYAAPAESELRENRLIPLSSKMVSDLNGVLLNKSTKSYSVAPVWLVLRSASILWRKGDFHKVRKEISVPGNSPFGAIWLLCGPRAEFGMLRIDAAQITDAE